jgi:hypothetical protein
MSSGVVALGIVYAVAMSLFVFYLVFRLFRGFFNLCGEHADDLRQAREYRDAQRAAEYQRRYEANQASDGIGGGIKAAIALTETAIQNERDRIFVATGQGRDDL